MGAELGRCTTRLSPLLCDFMKQLPTEQHRNFSQLTAQPMHLRQWGVTINQPLGKALTEGIKPIVSLNDATNLPQISSNGPWQTYLDAWGFVSGGPPHLVMDRTSQLPVNQYPLAKVVHNIVDP